MRTPIVMAAAVCGMLVTNAAMSGTDPVLEWNSIMVSTTAGQNPFFQARFAAITQLAVFEAVNAIDRDFEPYLGTITAPRGASPEAAATALITLRTLDGSTPPEFYSPTSSAPGAWQPTPSCPPAGGLLLQWRNLRPFAIERTDQFRSAPPPALTSERYARGYNEVMRVGSIDSAFRPQGRADVARFYAATAPVPVWNSVAAQVAVEQGRTMSENARALALMDVAIADASASVFDTKYAYDFWRPETAIHASGDTTWQPYIVTPCFPSYGSAHGSLSNAARKVLERVYGPRNHLITLSNPAVAGVILQYQTFEQITHDISDARVYGGIHFRFDQETGAEQGRRVGEYVHQHILRRVNGERDFGEAEPAAH